MTAYFEPDIRPGAIEFDDRINFQWGLFQSGVFSVRQRKLLLTYGETLKCLEMGLIQPETPTEERFVEFCLGMHEAGSECERLWLLYKEEVQRSYVLDTSNSIEDASRADIQSAKQ